MRHIIRSRRRLLAAAMGGVLAVTLAACGGGDDSGDEGGETGGTMVFGASADPVTLDGAYVSDGESLRPIRQIFEGLVTTAEGSTEIEPRLATEWETSADGLTWTFTLQDGVTFHDGEPFNAAAVCYNFDRWYNFTGILQSPNVSYYWQTAMGGFKVNEDPSLPPSLYASCQATDDTTVVMTLTRPSSVFLTALSLPSFSIASPKALQEYEANGVSGSGDSPQFTGTYGTEHPTGTGAFKFDSWTRGDKLTLVRNDDYWGEPAQLQTLIFQPIPDGPARRQALESGQIDGYDLVDPADVESLEGAGFQILRRPAFNVGYIGFNQALPPMDNPLIRQAVAHAINRENIISTQYPEGAVVAKEFMPPELWGYAEDVPTYEYNVDRAKQLIAESGVPAPAVTVWYPTGVSRPYMPNPEANFQLIQQDLQAAGFTVTPQSAPWTPDYLDAVDTGQAQIHLLGWTGDFGDPDNFIGTFFQAPSLQWGFNNQAIFDALNAAEAETDQGAREQAYQQANRLIMEFLPGLPYVHTEPAIALKAGVEGYVPSPVSDEDFSKVSVPSS
jgi:peptide/nickel transport system substrate-binding protein